jgi:glycosyltransferase involved in cell wall biosynthesis
LTRKRLISIAHHHPDLVRGGAQQAAYELFKGFEARPDYEPYFLAAVQHSILPQLIKPRTHIFSYDARPNEFLMPVRGYDGFWQSNAALHEAGSYQENSLLPEAGWSYAIDFLRELRPDIIHVNHTIYVGIEMLRAARVACPEARIIFTLHEFVPICNADGHMVRTNHQGLCDKAAPSRCTFCFPSRSPSDFFLRDRWFRGHFTHVDRFVAPSQFLRERYVAWGIPENMIVLIDYGRTSEGRRPAGVPAASEAHNRFGFFGQLIDSKGIGIIIDAVESLVRRGVEDFEVRIHGANLTFASENLQQKFKAALEQFRQIRFFGSYFNYEFPRLAAMVDWCVVPSTWWENSPLVIQEAFMARRPVLTGDIGGMAEKVRHNVDGLQFAAGDSESLADAMVRCLKEPALWARLAAGIPDILTVEEAVDLHRSLCFEGPLPPPATRNLWEAPWAEKVRAPKSSPEGAAKGRPR